MVLLCQFQGDVDVADPFPEKVAGPWTITCKATAKLAANQKGTRPETLHARERPLKRLNYGLLERDFLFLRECLLKGAQKGPRTFFALPKVHRTVGPTPTLPKPQILQSPKF